jgi:HEAT repeat protein
LSIFSKLFHNNQAQPVINTQIPFPKTTESKIEPTPRQTDRSSSDRDNEILLKNLNDSKPSIRATAVEKLANINNPDVLEHLLKASNDRSSFVRRTVAKALGNYSDRLVIESLKGLLKDGFDDVSKTASNALIKIGKPAVEPLIISLENGNKLELTFKTLKRINPNWKDTQRGKLCVSNFILKITDQNSSIRQSAADTLGEIGDKQAVEVLCSALKDQVWQVRSAAAGALGKIKDATAVESLISILFDEDPRVRVATADALGHLRDSRAINLLIKCFKDKEWQVRYHSEQALKEIGVLAIEPLVACLSDTDSAVCESAANVLSELGDEKGREVLRKIREQQFAGSLGISMKIVNRKTIEIRADSISKARTLIQSNTPEGYELLWEQIVWEEVLTKVSASAETPEEAFAAAEAKIPDMKGREYHILEKKVLVPANLRKIELMAFDEQEARSKAITQVATEDLSYSIKLIETGKPGLLGFDRKPNRYEVSIIQFAQVEIFFRKPAVLRIEVVERFLTPLNRAEKVEVSNLNPLIYEAIINEKRSGQPVSLITETPGLADLLRRLNIPDLERLAESVRLAMKVDNLIGEEAENQCLMAININPYNDMAVMSYGCLLANQGTPWVGEVWIEQAIQLNPANDKALKNLAALRSRYLH